jgi:hypothetical protein
MTNFLKLTPLGAVEGEGDKSAFLVNADLIVSLQRVESAIKGKARTVVTTTGGQTYAVTDTPADIVAAIELADEAKLVMPGSQAPAAETEPVPNGQTPATPPQAKPKGGKP